MKRLIKIALLVYILGRGSAIIKDINERIPARDVTGKGSGIAEYADELFRSMGFASQNPNDS